MRLLLIALSAVVAPIWAAAIPDTNTTSNTLVARGQVTCGDKKLPIEWMYNWGVQGFCNAFEKTKDNPMGARLISLPRPLVFTQVLNSYEDGKPLPWVYKIHIKNEGTMPPDQWVTHEKCVRKFKEILSEGKLGNEYCVVDGTKDVLFQHGKIEEQISTLGGKLVFTSYRREGMSDDPSKWPDH